MLRPYQLWTESLFGAGDSDSGPRFPEPARLPVDSGQASGERVQKLYDYLTSGVKAEIEREEDEGVADDSFS